VEEKMMDAVRDWRRSEAAVSPGRTRSQGPIGFPPIPFTVPGVLLVGLVVLPVLGAKVAWMAAGRRPPVNPALLADRMAW
jgi:hypothetical protein